MGREMKLWNKGWDLDGEIERYTVGDDPELDRALVPYDCVASMVHARVLEKAGVLTGDEVVRLVGALESLKASAEAGEFKILREEEDCHTALENRLVAELGDLGKKIHTARSRNDQVLGALRLYMKERLSSVGGLIDDLVMAMGRRIQSVGEFPMPGYTHMRKAMPSSFSMWMGSFMESMEDNKVLLEAVQSLIDQNPLGSGAGYGIPVIDIDREFSARELGFAKVQINPLYVQSSRGKFEASVVAALVNIMVDLNKLSSDLILFTMEELKYFSLPREICTGSSIMPQKLNPDVLEIMRARYHEVLANEFLIRSMTANLPSGYNRDLQRTKKPLMESFTITESSLRIITHVTEKLEVNTEACERACTDEVFATQRVYELVKQGIPFRDAYRQVAAELFEGV
jgi:argininosuccinate lyase